MSPAWTTSLALFGRDGSACATTGWPAAAFAERGTVPADWQRWVQAGNGRVTFDVTPADAHRLLATVRTWMAEENAPDALVANNLELQRFVRQLVAAEFPDLRVLTAEEASALSSSAAAGHHA